jgi:hypothetical protein
MEASGMAVEKKVVSTKKGEPSGTKMPEAQKFTLALAVRFSKVPVLPEKLLKEVPPGVGSALFKKKC